MKILRLKIYQENAHFRIPTSGAPAPLLTYPLPPPSTVLGFLRKITRIVAWYKFVLIDNASISGSATSSSELNTVLLNAVKSIDLLDIVRGNEILNAKLVDAVRSGKFIDIINSDNTTLSIQGKWSGVSNDIQRLLFFEYGSQSKDSKSMNISYDKKNIVNVQQLHECTWVIHVKSDDSIIDLIDVAIDTYPHAFRLGRKEDLIIDIEKKIVTLKEKKSFDFGWNTRIDRNMYIYAPWSSDAMLSGSEVLSGSSFLPAGLYRATLDTRLHGNKIRSAGFISLLFNSAEAVNIKSEEVFSDGEYAVIWLWNNSRVAG